MKKLVMLGFIMAFLVLAPTVKAQPYCVEFIAGQHTDVGDVCVERVGDTLEIQITIDDPLYPLQESHVHVAPTLEGIPQKNGNPPPGQFLWTADGDGLAIVPLVGELPGAKKKDAPIPYDWTGEETLVIAVHGVVGICDCETLLMALPESVEAVIEYPGFPEVDSYFKVTIAGDGLLGGLHRGWCADADTLVEGDGTPLVGDIYSTLCDDMLEIPGDAIAYDSNLPAVNWLLNNWEAEGYTVGDAQAAIWLLLSDKYPDPPLGTASIEENSLWPADQAFDPDRALDLEEAALENDDFWPGCGEVMAVVFIPPVWDVEWPLTELGDLRQAVLIEIPAPCGCETAWAGIEVEPADDDDGDGYGLEFPGKNWALYFIYDLPVVITPGVN